MSHRSLQLLLTIVVAGGAGRAPALAQTGDRLTAPDGAADAQFGHSVIVRGDVAIVGAPYQPFEDEGPERRGAAYVFDLATREPRHRLFDDALGAGAAFGFSLAIHGDLAIVGAPGDDHAGTATGSAYVFDVVTGDLIRKLVLEGAWGGELFGHGVALRDGLAVVGAPRDNHNPRELPTGAVYVFDVWTGDLVLPRLVANDAEEDQAFGWSVALGADRILVGAPEDRGATGAVYVLDRATGAQLRKLTPDDPDPSFFTFGHAVAVSGGRALIGAPGDDHAGASAGSAWLFDTGSGELLHRMTAGAPSDHDAFGYAVALDGDLVLIGASGNGHAGDNAGAAHLFDARSGQPIRTWVAADASPQVRFGHAVSISADVALVGATLHDESAENAGAAYVFEHCGGDLDGDRVVGFSDLLAVLAAWRAYEPCPPYMPEDLDHDCEVGFNDLLIVLTTWGPCL